MREVSLFTMIRSERKVLQDELHKCEIELKPLLEADISSPVVQKVILTVRFEVYFQTVLADVEISSDGSVLIRSYCPDPYSTKTTTLKTPLKTHVTFIYHTDYRKLFPRKSVYSYGDHSIISNTVMNGISGMENWTARNEYSKCNMFSFPYHIVLYLEISTNMFPARFPGEFVFQCHCLNESIPFHIQKHAQHRREWTRPL